jgi:hypothetical protein
MTANTYHVNWRIKGLKKLRLVTGDSINLTEDEAAPFIRTGALTLEKQSLPIPPMLDEPADLSTKTKAQLVEYAHETFGLTLDVNKKKDELLAVIAEASEPDTEV